MNPMALPMRSAAVLTGRAAAMDPAAAVTDRAAATDQKAAAITRTAAARNQEAAATIRTAAHDQGVYQGADSEAAHKVNETRPQRRRDN